MKRRTGRAERNLSGAAALFPLLAALWVLPRMFPFREAPAPSVSAAAESARIAASPSSGRYEVQDGAVSPIPGTATARLRLDATVDAVNDDLALLADRVGARIELFPEEGVTGLRISGLIVPFYDNDAGRLAALRDRGRERPVEALTNVVEILEARLSEPQSILGPEDAVRQRDLTRLARDVRDALADAEAQNRAATSRYREELTDAARRAGGPFHRRGPLRVAEVVLAALLAATLRAAVSSRRGRREAPPLALGLSVAAATAVAGVLLLEGTELLPVDPVTGTALRFLPLAALLGFLASAGLEREWNGGEKDATEPEPAPPAARGERHEEWAEASDDGVPEPVGSPASELELPDAPSSGPRAPAADHPPGPPAEALPFFRRRNRP